MNELQNIQRVVSWSSTKNDDGTYTAKAYSFDQRSQTVVHARYTNTSRSKAVTSAKKAVKYLKAQQKKY